MKSKTRWGSLQTPYNFTQQAHRRASTQPVYKDESTQTMWDLLDKVDKYFEDAKKTAKKKKK